MTRHFAFIVCVPFPVDHCVSQGAKWGSVPPALTSLPWLRPGAIRMAPAPLGAFRLSCASVPPALECRCSGRRPLRLPPRVGGVASPRCPAARPKSTRRRPSPHRRKLPHCHCRRRWLRWLGSFHRGVAGANFAAVGKPYKQATGVSRFPTPGGTVLASTYTAQSGAQCANGEQAVNKSPIAYL